MKAQKTPDSQNNPEEKYKPEVSYFLISDYTTKLE